MLAARMRLVSSSRKTKLIMNEIELRQLLNELCGEIRTLRREVMQLRSDRYDENLRGRFFTMKEACSFLKISRTTMQRRLTDGEIGFAIKKGKSWLFPAEKLKIYASGL